MDLKKEVESLTEDGNRRRHEAKIKLAAVSKSSSNMEIGVLKYSITLSTMGIFVGILKSLLIEGSTCEDFKQIKQHVVSFFEEFYSEKVSDWPFFDGLNMEGLGDIEREWLERNFMEAKIFEILSSLAGKNLRDLMVFQ